MSSEDSLNIELMSFGLKVANIGYTNGIVFLTFSLSLVSSLSLSFLLSTAFLSLSFPSFSPTLSPPPSLSLHLLSLSLHLPPFLSTSFPFPLTPFPLSFSRAFSLPLSSLQSLFLLFTLSTSPFHSIALPVFPFISLSHRSLPHTPYRSFHHIVYDHKLCVGSTVYQFAVLSTYQIFLRCIFM